MGFISRWASALARALTPGPTDDYWYKDIRRPTAAGVSIDENSALNYSAVWAATRIIAETCATLPLKLYRRLEPSGKEPAKEHPLFRVLRLVPNPEADAVPFWESLFMHAVNWGNGFAEIQRNGAGQIIALWPVHPSRVKQPIRDAGGRRLYRIRQDVGPDRPVRAADLFHVVGPLSDDGWGKGIITHARESIAMGVATERYGGAFFGNGASASVALKHPQRLTEAAATRLRESFAAKHVGAEKAHGVVVLEEGMDVVRMDYPPEDIQFLATRQHNIIEISRWYRVPPHVLGDLTRQGYNSLEQENTALVVHTFRPWLVRTESAINRQLLTAAESTTYFAEFLVDGLLRGDAPTRTTALTQQFLNGALTIDEWREIENRNPTGEENGSKHFVPLNLTTLDKAGEANEAERPEEKPEEEKPDESGKGDSSDDDAGGLSSNGSADGGDVQFGDASHAAQRLLVSTVQRMLRMEANEARRAAKKPKEFLNRIDAFYEDFPGTLREALGPVVEVCLATAGDAREPAGVVSAVVARHVVESLEGLLKAAEVQANELGAAVEKCIAKWEVRTAGSGIL